MRIEDYEGKVYQERYANIPCNSSEDIIAAIHESYDPILDYARQIHQIYRDMMDSLIMYFYFKYINTRYTSKIYKTQNMELDTFYQISNLMNNVQKLILLIGNPSTGFISHMNCSKYLINT